MLISPFSTLPFKYFRYTVWHKGNRDIHPTFQLKDFTSTKLKKDNILYRFKIKCSK